MLDEIKNKLKEIKNSDEFKEWKKEHKNAYLSSIFLKECWQFDFYDPDKDKGNGIRDI